MESSLLGSTDGGQNPLGREEISLHWIEAFDGFRVVCLVLLSESFLSGERILPSLVHLICSRL